MRRMIKSGLAPTSIQTLQKLLERKEAGMMIRDEPWVSAERGKTRQINETNVHQPMFVARSKAREKVKCRCA